MHEYCLFDLSEPGRLAPTMVQQTADGISAEGEEAIAIMLKKQG